METHLHLGRASWRGARRPARTSIVLLLIATASLTGLVPSSTGDVVVLAVALPSPRGETAAIWDGAAAYVFGGFDGAQYLDEIVRFSPENGTLQVMDARLPTARSGLSAIFDGQHAYLFGGLGANGAVDEILRYDPASDSITVMAGRLPSPRHGMSSVWDGDHAYLFGGRTTQVGAYSHIAEILAYNPAADAVAPMGAKLILPLVDTMAIWDGQYAYIMGGWGWWKYTPVHWIQRFDPSADKIDYAPAGLPYPVDRAAAVWDGSRAHIFGGDTHAQFVERTRTFARDYVLSFDPATQEALSVDKLPAPRSSPSAVWAGDRAYVFGGYRLLGEAVQAMADILAVEPVPSEPAVGGPPVTRAFTFGPQGRQGWFRGDVTVVLQCDTSDASPATPSFALDAAASAPYQGPILIHGEGVHELRFGCVDGQGRSETTKSLVVRIDVTPPVPNSNIFGGNFYVADESVVWFYQTPTGSDVIVGDHGYYTWAYEFESLGLRMEWFVDGSPRGAIEGMVSPGSYRILYEGSKESAGTHAITLTAFDLAGNPGSITKEVRSVPTSPDGVVATVNDV